MSALQKFPWIKPLYTSLLHNRRQNKLPHAILLTGIDGLAKLEMAQQFANKLLCQTEQDDNSKAVELPCGVCHDCELFCANHHPDYLLIEPEKKDGNILVDQIRQLTSFVSLKSHLGGMQIIIINQAHRLNRNAANSLLKTLEEPTPNVLLILISSHPNRLPATVKSRCQVRVMDIPLGEVALDWLSSNGTQTELSEHALMALRLSFGAPVLAQTYLQDGVVAHYHTQFKQFLLFNTKPLSVVDVAASWVKEGGKQSLHWLVYWVSILIRIKFQLNDAATVTGKDGQQLQNLAQSVDLIRLYSFYDRLLASVKLMDTQVNLQLLFEDVLISWRQIRVSK